MPEVEADIFGGFIYTTTHSPNTTTHTQPHTVHTHTVQTAPLATETPGGG